jgi:hypothetical protein
VVLRSLFVNRPSASAFPFPLFDLFMNPH